MARVHNKHNRTAPADAIYIGRGSPYGNPFVIGVHGDREEVCDRYEREVLPTLDLEPLRGKDLVCFCAPKRCHGDSILAALRARQSGEGERLREALNVGEKFLNACFSAWSCGEPYHRVKTMTDRADEFRASLDSIAALRATDEGSK